MNCRGDGSGETVDAKVLIEEAVVGSEVGCAILGNDPPLLAGEVDRIALTHGFFRIHQEKDPETGSENATPIVPADISAESAQAVSRKLPKPLSRLGMSRTLPGGHVSKG